MPRVPTHRYVDPLDAVWLASAHRIGLRVGRSAEVYAATDARGTLLLGTGETLDPDDCLAQMIFHELCHSLVEGPASFRLHDWGLSNEHGGDAWRERACLRVQAALSDRFGLRPLLAPTTEFRGFYDGLPDDPLAWAGGEPPAEVAAARAALPRAEQAPWAPHLLAALRATARIAHAVADIGTAELEGPLRPLWEGVTPDDG